MTPTEYYRKLIESDQILSDDQQASVIDRLQVIYDSLIQAPQKATFLTKLKGKKKILTQGLYLWGEVGRWKDFPD